MLRVLLAGVVCLSSSASSVSAQGIALPAPTWPTSDVVVKEFHPPWPDWLVGHRGLDLATRRGDQIRTPKAGVLIWKGRPGGVPTVVVLHGAARATYQPVSTALPLLTKVREGQPIGTVAKATAHCNQCIHWGLRIAERYLDPRLLLGRASARLVAPGSEPY